MREFKFEKLVRDNIVPGMEASGAEPNTHTLSQEEFVQALKLKLIEESQELAGDIESKVAGELADVQEIVDTLCEVLGISRDDLIELQRQKREKAGGFSNRVYIDSVKISEDDPWVEHFLSSPEKYPEVK